MPGIGWAEVVGSKVDGIPVGGRYFGWYPMARFHDVAASATPSGLRDDGEHRQAHAPTYRSYVEASLDPLYPGGAPPEDRPDLEDRHALLRGLLLTGFLIEESLADRPGGAPEQIVVLSASSKTGIGLAQRAKARGESEVVGVTSAGNAAFVESLGFYDRVVGYDAVRELDEVTTAVVDMSGASGVVAEIHERLGDKIACSLIVGRSHHDARPAIVGGAAQEFFFAPAEVERRIAEWGAEEYQVRTLSALTTFVRESRRWMRVDHSSGAEGAQAAWDRVYAGKVPPDIGRVVSLHDEREAM